MATRSINSVQSTIARLSLWCHTMSKYSKHTARLARQCHRLYSVKRVQQSLCFFFFSWGGPRTVAVHGSSFIHTHVVRSGRLSTTDTSIMRSVKKGDKTSSMHKSLIIKTTPRSQTFNFLNFRLTQMHCINEWIFTCCFKWANPAACTLVLSSPTLIVLNYIR